MPSKQLAQRRNPEEKHSLSIPAALDKALLQNVLPQLHIKYKIKSPIHTEMYRQTNKPNNDGKILAPYT